MAKVEGLRGKLALIVLGAEGIKKEGEAVDAALRLIAIRAFRRARRGDEEGALELLEPTEIVISTFKGPGRNDLTLSYRSQVVVTHAAHEAPCFVALLAVALADMIGKLTGRIFYRRAVHAFGVCEGEELDADGDGFGLSEIERGRLTAEKHGKIAGAFEELEANHAAHVEEIKGKAGK